MASFLSIFTCSVSLQENHLVMFCILTPLIKYILSDQSQTIQDQIVGGSSEGGLVLRGKQPPARERRPYSAA